VSVVHGSPPLFVRLEAASTLPPLRAGFVGGAACPPGLVARYDERGTRLMQQYGMTEAGTISTCLADDPPETRYTTVGRAFLGHELRTVELSDAPDGEVQVRGEHIWPSLFSRPWSDAEMTPDGWLRTGDLGKIDAAGNLTIAGRAKEVVQTGGFSVYPGEVEAFLHTFPPTASAAVVGVPHPSLGEALVAFIVTRPGASFDGRAFNAFCRAGIAGYKIPYRVILLDELPLLASGKPDRSALAQRAADEASPSRER